MEDQQPTLHESEQKDQAVEQPVKQDEAKPAKRRGRPTKRQDEQPPQGQDEGKEQGQEVVLSDKPDAVPSDDHPDPVDNGGDADTGDSLPDETVDREGQEEDSGDVLEGEDEAAEGDEDNLGGSVRRKGRGIEFDDDAIVKEIEASKPKVDPEAIERKKRFDEVARDVSKEFGFEVESIDDFKQVIGRTFEELKAREEAINQFKQQIESEPLVVKTLKELDKEGKLLANPRELARLFNQMATDYANPEQVSDMDVIVEYIARKNPNLTREEINERARQTYEDDPIQRTIDAERFRSNLVEINKKETERLRAALKPEPIDDNATFEGYSKEQIKLMEENQKASIELRNRMTHEARNALKSVDSIRGVGLGNNVRPERIFESPRAARDLEEQGGIVGVILQDLFDENGFVREHAKPFLAEALYRRYYPETWKRITKVASDLEKSKIEAAVNSKLAKSTVPKRESVDRGEETKPSSPLSHAPITVKYPLR